MAAKRSHTYVKQPVIPVIIIIMYSDHALINALSAYMIDINLNTILYTHAEHVPKQFI